MAGGKKTCSIRTPKSLIPFFPSLIVVLFHFLPCAIPKPLNLGFPSFGPNTKGIDYQGDAIALSTGEIALTRIRVDQSLLDSVGRVISDQPLHLWDEKTGKLADFTTHFSFSITLRNRSYSGDSLAFFLVSEGAGIPPNSTGGFLGLFSNHSIVSSPTGNKTVAVEFDSHQNDWDPSDDHVGINVDNIISAKSKPWKTSIKNGRKASAWVSYNSTTHNLSVFLTYDENPIFCGNSTLYHIVDLRKILPEWVDFGFSAATGDWVEFHQIHTWEFSSSDIDGEGEKKTGLVVGLTVSIGALVFCGAFLGLLRKIRSRRKEDEGLEMGEPMDDEFSKGTGPKRFSRMELALATNNFAEEGKLGQGGFGGVYRGFLNELNMNVAVKRVSKGSKQGWKEFVSEVKIISRLRHRNLVQLVGWCHEKGEFLLVYEFMTNGSLDSHLFGSKSVLQWENRFKIAHGLAQALLYLQEEWEECVVHRDIKSSNVLLDSGFNAKLGDFGLARLVHHDSDLQTTMLAGTMGYLAPECLITCKASKESDVYSFGIVALEIACGRRAVEPKEEGKKVRVVEWVWDLYGRGSVLDAADKRLEMEFDEKEMERLMVVGLWCAHPDVSLRPSIKHVINVLDGEAVLSKLPLRMPVPVFLSAAINVGEERTSMSLNTVSSNADFFGSSLYIDSTYKLDADTMKLGESEMSS